MGAVEVLFGYVFDASQLGPNGGGDARQGWVLLVVSEIVILDPFQPAGNLQGFVNGVSKGIVGCDNARNSDDQGKKGGVLLPRKTEVHEAY